MKKRDYDGAIAAFTASLEIAPQNINVINARGIAYSFKGDDERPTTICACSCVRLTVVPTTAA